MRRTRSTPLATGAPALRSERKPLGAGHLHLVNLSVRFSISWAKKRFVIAWVTVSLEGVIGLLSRVVLCGLMEVLMELLIDKIGVWLGWAVLWGPVLFLLYGDSRPEDETNFFQRHREGSSPSPHPNSLRSPGERQGSLFRWSSISFACRGG